MAHVIDTNLCISCGACEVECPTEAISAEADIYMIDPERCIDCGACFNVCPTDAAHPA